MSQLHNNNDSGIKCQYKALPVADAEIDGGGPLKARFGNGVYSIGKVARRSRIDGLPSFLTVDRVVNHSIDDYPESLRAAIQDELLPFNAEFWTRYNADLEAEEERRASGYLERLAKSQQISKKAVCGSWSAVLSCDCGARYAKVLYCGREWCENCRTESHNRRIARWLPKLRQMQGLGYFVITFPVELRALLHNKRSLQITGRRCSAVFKRTLGYERGLRRWHTHGSKCQYCGGELNHQSARCKRCGKLSVNQNYNPHLNVIVDGGYISPDRLAYIKRKITFALVPKGLRGCLKSDGLLEIHYQYRETPAAMMHTLKYVTRPTFLNESWDDGLAAKLTGFRRCGTWGKWHSPAVWDSKPYEPEDVSSFQALTALEHKVCPVCGSVGSFTAEIVETARALTGDAVEIGAGYYQLRSFAPSFMDKNIAT